MKNKKLSIGHSSATKKVNLIPKNPCKILLIIMFNKHLFLKTITKNIF